MTMVTRWNPFRDFDDIYRAGLHSTGFGASDLAAHQATWLPAVDIVETDNEFRLLLDIPAVSAQDVKIALEDNVLTISGERRASELAAPLEQSGEETAETPSSEAASGVRHHRRERRVGRFSRSFRLPETVDEEAIEASAKDGVLTLVITKRAQPQPRKIEVKVH